MLPTHTHISIGHSTNAIRAMVLIQFSSNDGFCCLLCTAENLWPGTHIINLRRKKTIFAEVIIGRAELSPSQSLFNRNIQQYSLGARIVATSIKKHTK